MNRLFWMTRPFVWRWRLGYWDWDASRVAMRLAINPDHKFKKKASKKR